MITEVPDRDGAALAVLPKAGNPFFLLWGLGGKVASAGLHGQAVLIRLPVHFNFQAMVAAILLYVSGGKLQQL
jgi:hypothetical protein